ncbi:MAG: cell wall anchor protein, partial [Porphyromonadaceae bacterium]|nr:cell wall anchor protein [Porphyromonadaceae bacterium]
MGIKKYNRCVFALLLATMAFPLSLMQVSAADVSVHASIDSLALWMGEQTRVRLRVAQDEGEKVWLLPTFSDTLVTGIEVLEVSRPDTVKLGHDRLQIDRSLLITSFDSGFFYIPPFRYLVGDDTLSTEALSLKILPMEVDLEQSIVDIKNVRAPSSAWWLLLWDNMPLWGWIVLILLILIAVGIVLYIL